MMRAMTDDANPPSDPSHHAPSDGATAGEPMPRPALDRRDLFRGGATLVVGAAIGCGKREEPKPAPAAPPPKASPNAKAMDELADKVKKQEVASESMPAVELVELTFADLEARMAAGTDTAKSLVQKYRQRIEAMDQKGPMLRSVLELNPDAEAIADELDADRKAGKKRGPLHGIPILIKDNIDTGDKMTPPAGSLALEGSHAEKDSFVVAKLRAAGAIILGKTNLSEWANFRGIAASSGWSGRGAQRRPPHPLDRPPWGSSGGSGVAAASSLCAAAIGSETDGSIVSPSSCN